MEITKALKETLAEEGISPTQLAASAGVSEGAARKWLYKKGKPKGEALLKLMEKYPSLREKLGYEKVAS